MNVSINTTCPYCGVGCGLSVDRSHPNGSVSISGDQGHPANFGRLCSKGAALGDTLSLSGRLLHPLIDGQQTGWTTALDRVAKEFADIIEKYGPDAVAFYLSGQLLTEDYYVANKLAKGFIGTANIDTNSRLCMSSSVAAHKRAFGSDTVPGNYQDLEAADLIVFVGSNAAWCHPVLYQRIIAAKSKNTDRKIVVVDPRRTATCDAADLHLALAPGSDVALFNGLLCALERRGKIDKNFVEKSTHGIEYALRAAATGPTALQEVARVCGLDEGRLRTFFDWFADSHNVVTLFSQGVNQSTSGTDKANAIINCHLLTGRIGRPGMGPFSLTGQPNAMGGREVGGLANQLAAHMEIGDPKHRDLVKRFWRAPKLVDKPGLTAVDMFRAVGDGSIKAVWIMGTNPAVSLPDSDRVRAALDRCELVVVSDTERHTDTTAFADILLPARAWGEKDGTVTNSERRLSRQRPFLPVPGEAKPDWWMLCEVGKRLGFEEAFSFPNPAQIFREHAALSGFENGGGRDFDISGLAEIDDAAYDALAPVQWPVTARAPIGTARMFGDGAFFTSTGKANFVALTSRPTGAETNAEHPLVLNTGRTRDHWHTMTRTGKSPRLSAHTVEPRVEMHPSDAPRHGVVNGELVEITSRQGHMIARVDITEAQRHGSVFAPMHWNDQFASQGRVDALVAPHLDPISGQPESKYTPVALRPYHPAWQAFALSRDELSMTPGDYWVRAAGRGFHRYEIAGEDAPEDWDAWARALLKADETGSEWISYSDTGAGARRYARIAASRLQGCLFVATDHRLPARNWLAGLFALDRIEPATRAGLLTGGPANGSEYAGPTVCSCFAVGKEQIMRAIRDNGLTTLAGIGDALSAGTNCGSCRPELNDLLRQVSETAEP